MCWDFIGDQFKVISPHPNLNRFHIFSWCFQFKWEMVTFSRWKHCPYVDDELFPVYHDSGVTQHNHRGRKLCFFGLRKETFCFWRSKYWPTTVQEYDTYCWPAGVHSPLPADVGRKIQHSSAKALLPGQTCRKIVILYHYQWVIITL